MAVGGSRDLCFWYHTGCIDWPCGCLGGGIRERGGWAHGVRNCEWAVTCVERGESTSKRSMKSTGCLNFAWDINTYTLVTRLLVHFRLEEDKRGPLVTRPHHKLLLYAHVP